MTITKRKPFREKLTESERRQRLIAANEALVYFAPYTHLIYELSHVYVSWSVTGSTTKRRQWLVRSGQSFYPVWSHKWPHGGTACTALSQLVRWVQGHPVLPLRTWHYWCDQKVYLAREHGPLLVATLEGAGYPLRGLCVLCGEVITGSMDWWCLRDVSGPCCGLTSGCRQKIEPNKPDYKSAAVSN